MTDWILYKDVHPEHLDIDRAMKLLTNSLHGFQPKWDKYVQETYKDYQKERLDYVDIGEHASFIRDGIFANNTEGFDKFFDTVEYVLNNCDSTVENFVVVGLLESIQNICSGEKINIWTGFDKWLKPTTKKVWDNLIFTWEGTDAIENYKAKHPSDDRLIK